ncbi:MAG: DUF5329 domain-containing protein [Deltaproteobacteria bacterium]|nr:DUF5329 domain-containing protein [Deltaproteobacteria bacterium]MBW2660062.1 DUF5329 domain-containing protein [Deltaproteobacteria bacterium]
MMKFSALILSLFVLISANIVFAADNEEIEYLLSFVAASDCVFIRNGSEHGAGDARDHLEMKYNYVKKRIKTADMFIDKIAAKSSITRRKYKVRCGGKEFATEKWLKDALAAHRASADK